MPNSITNVGFQSDYAADQSEILRRQKMAEAMQQQAQTPIDPGRQAGGWAIPISPWEGAAKLAQAYGSQLHAQSAQDKQRELSTRAQSEYAQAMRRGMESMQGTPAQEMPGSELSMPFQSEARKPDMLAAMGHFGSNSQTAPIAQMLMAKQLQDPKYHNVGGHLVPEPKPGQTEPVAPVFSAPKYHTVGDSLIPEPALGQQGGVQQPQGPQPISQQPQVPPMQGTPPQGLQPVYTAPQKPPTGFHAGKDGKFEVDPNWLDAELKLKNAGATRVQQNVASFVPANEEAQRDFMKGLRARYDQLQSAPAVMDNIEKAKQLIPSAVAFTGSGANVKLNAAKFLNNNLGTTINTEGVKSAEELNSRLFMGVMENLKKMDSQPSQSQQAALQKGLGEIGTDPSALPRVLDVFGDIVRQKVDIHNQEVEGAEKKGVKFPYNPRIKLQRGAQGIDPATQALLDKYAPRQ